MKILQSIILVVILSPISSLSKNYYYTKELNNKTSRNCQNVRAALFYKGDMEQACDCIEKYLQTKATIDDSDNQPRTHAEAIMTGGYRMAALEIIVKKNAIRTILANESDDVKWEEYDQLINHARDLETKCKKEKTAEREKISAEQ